VRQFIPRQVVADSRRAAAKALAVQAAIAIESDVVLLFETLDHGLGRVTALVNDAGILEQQMRVEDMDAGRIASRPPWHECKPLKARRAGPGTNRTKEPVKKLNAKAKLFQRNRVPIDAPRGPEACS